MPLFELLQIELRSSALHRALNAMALTLLKIRAPLDMSILFSCSLMAVQLVRCLAHKAGRCGRCL